ncbi:hypothetical protein QR680_013099 [Steinernema hermaphroditum]|uniref:Glucosidase 2 subunit beta n=1 Tax=Steinernema hermaphroditum TaxID=289476 RepID=A0AA39M1P4_9BILA|nr:hypothetical protein QR680_013099 [Steinernema hermaphroditum]
MRLSTATLLLLSLAVALSEKPSEYGDRPRGVPLSKSALYQENGGDFECLDGKKKIPFEQVNDDYCDCEDGSDEPGTSACPNGRFHCLNIGHRPLDIPTSRVNDHICDCCDGSDEWEEMVSCPNVCSELGAKAREEAEKRSATRKAGFEERKKLVAEGQKQRAEKTSSIESYKVELEALKPKKDELQTKKDDIEAKEKEAKEKHDNAWNALMEEKRKAAATAIFGQIDKDGDNKITVKEIQEFSVFDKDGDGSVSEEEAKNYMHGGEEADFQNYLDNLHHDVKDLFTKTAEAEQKAEEVVDAESESDDGMNDLDDIESELDKKENEDVKPPYDEETQKLIEEADKLRNEFNDVNRKVTNLESDIRDAENFAEQDFGSDFAWASLKGQCFEKNDNQYTYRLCLFDRAVQKDRGSEISLGYWKGWTGASEETKYDEQTYDNGQGCWNGPNRSTKVSINCGEQTELTEVSEPSKCEYLFVMTSPAACEDPEKDHVVHTEL